MIRHMAQANGTNTMSAIVCVQQGAEETPGKENEDGSPKEPRIPGVALVQRGGRDKADGTNKAA